ncbi:ComEA family DNA-binding protein [Nocardia sp. CT2-14]|uniref:ComEA family DNA-binding protein n=1 Tax=Nocardia aurantiaca TaxID=2675850 RepID=A0A6I3KR53_9NOCA|nr:ComEA family DNA-binding protein [Nocardia aurantiaca]
MVPERFRGTRWDPGPRGVLVIAALGVLAILVAGYVSLREKPVSQPVPPIASLSETAPVDQESPSPQAAVAPTATAVPTGAATPSELVVSVVGLVEHGGLRRFPLGARVADALRAAAPRPDADLSALNLAQPLTDGDQIVIGRPAPRPTTQLVGTTIVNSAHPAADSPSPSGIPRPPSTPAKVNLNTATESDLDGLPGIGPVTARAILTWRGSHGRFTSIDQLTEIQGIGHSRLIRLRDRVTV